MVKQFEIFLWSIVLLAGLTCPAFAQRIEVENAGEAELIKPSEHIELSGVATIDNNPDLVLTANDDKSSLRILNLKDTTVKGYVSIEGITRTDWEGLARDPEGYYYALNQLQVVRFSLKGVDIKADQILVKPDRKWKLFFPPNECDLPATYETEIEGIAIRTTNSNSKNSTLELLIGRRKPGDLVRIFKTNIAPLPKSEATLWLKCFSKPFYAGMNDGVPFELSSLEYVIKWNGSLIITSAEEKSSAGNLHGNALWFLPDPPSDNSPVAPQLVWLFGNGKKAEGITLLQSDDPTKIEAIIVYDNDGKDQSMVQKIVLTRWPKVSVPSGANDSKPAPAQTPPHQKPEFN